MKECVVGIDLGATKIEIVLVEESCSIIARERYQVDPSKGALVLIAEMIGVTSLLLHREHRKPMACGIAVAGQVDAASGCVLFAPNLRWQSIALKDLVESALGVKTLVLNDVRAAMLGEWLFGAGRDSSDCVTVFVGTGIGGGMVSAGSLVQGVTHTAGEIGHMIVDIKGPLCSCGLRGCLEAVASGWAIARSAKDRVESDPASGRLLLEYAGKGAISALHVAECAQLGCAISNEILAHALEALIAASISIVNVLNPERLIFGGGVFLGQPAWLEKIDKGVRKGALKASTEKLTCFAAALRGDAGLIGAATAARGYPK